jgi:hypothetical protein
VGERSPFRNVIPWPDAETLADVMRQAHAWGRSETCPPRMQMYAAGRGLFVGATGALMLAQGADFPEEMVMEVQTDLGPQCLDSRGAWVMPGVWHAAMRARGQLVTTFWDFAAFVAWLRPTSTFQQEARQALPGVALLGCGLLFTLGAETPRLDEGAFADWVWGNYGCHPYWGRQIACDLNARGHRATTVQSVFATKVEAMAAGFASFGVTLQRSWPKPGAGIGTPPPAHCAIAVDYAAIDLPAVLARLQAGVPAI